LRKPNLINSCLDFALTLVDSTDESSTATKTLANYVEGLANSSDRNILNRLKEYLSQIRSDMVLSMQQQFMQSSDARFIGRLMLED
jgi:hypothetical protein